MCLFVWELDTDWQDLVKLIGCSLLLEGSNNKDRRVNVEWLEVRVPMWSGLDKFLTHVQEKHVNWGFRDCKCFWLIFDLHLTCIYLTPLLNLLRLCSLIRTTYLNTTYTYSYKTNCAFYSVNDSTFPTARISQMDILYHYFNYLKKLSMNKGPVFYFVVVLTSHCMLPFCQTVNMS